MSQFDDMQRRKPTKQDLAALAEKYGRTRMYGDTYWFIEDLGLFAAERFAINKAGSIFRLGVIPTDCQITYNGMAKALEVPVESLLPVEKAEAGKSDRLH